MGIDAEMFIKRKGPRPTTAQIADWNRQLLSVFNEKQFIPDRALSLSGEGYGDPADCGRVHYQDGDPIYAAKGEWFIEVNLYTRWYGEGYPRGNWQLLVAVARWLEEVIGGEVWYGGDSSGVCAELFDESARQKMIQYAKTQDE